MPRRILEDVENVEYGWNTSDCQMLVWEKLVSHWTDELANSSSYCTGQVQSAD